MSKKIVPLSVCIPCFPRDTNKLKRCLDSINSQSVLPSEVVIGHSQMNDNQKHKLLETLIGYDFDIVIANTEEKAFAGINRNRAALKAKENYISFFDSDDIMHKQRIEIIYNLFIKYNAKCIIHSFYGYKNFSKVNEFHSNIVLKDREVLKGNFMYKLYKSHLPWKHKMWYNPKKEINHLPHINHGHISITKEVISIVKQTNKPRGQDSEFVHNILSYYKDKLLDSNIFLYYPKSLTYYVDSNSQN